MTTLENFQWFTKASSNALPNSNRRGSTTQAAQKAMSLVGNTESTLQRGGVDILNIAGTPHHQRILTIVDGFREGVSDAEEQPWLIWRFKETVMPL